MSDNGTRRFESAVLVAQGLSANPELYRQLCSDAEFVKCITGDRPGVSVVIARRALATIDALLAELAKEPAEPRSDGERRYKAIPCWSHARTPTEGNHEH